MSIQGRQYTFMDINTKNHFSAWIPDELSVGSFVNTARALELIPDEAAEILFICRGSVLVARDIDGLPFVECVNVTDTEDIGIVYVIEKRHPKFTTSLRNSLVMFRNIILSGNQREKEQLIKRHPNWGKNIRSLAITYLVDPEILREMVNL